MTESALETIKRLTRLVPDFPEDGVLFRDLSPVFADAAAFALVVDEVIAPFVGAFDLVAGVEARGFVLAAAAARGTDTGMLMLRKPGKLPGEVLSESYELEYGSAALEIHSGLNGSRILLLDDVLATGGTLAAASTLLERAGGFVAGVAVVVEIEALGGRERVGRDIHSLQVV